MAATFPGVDRKLHIAMFPWPAFGHMMPWLELAKLISGTGIHSVSFISSPRNTDRLRKMVNPSNYPSLRFVDLPLLPVDGLPPSAEATSDLRPDQVQYLKKSLDLVREPMSVLLGSLRPDWVFYDFIQYWVGSVATQLGLRSCFFSIFIPAALAFVGPPEGVVEGGGGCRTTPEEFTVVPSWFDFPTSVAYKYYDIKNAFDIVEVNGVTGLSDLARLGLAVQNCDIVLVRSCSVFDSDYLRVLDTIYQHKPVYPVGQLLSCPTEDDDDEWEPIKRWLDERERGSVIYVAFGSEAKPSPGQLTELALGIEASGFPFFWVLKTHRGESDTHVLELPSGFLERTRGRGMVHTSWAPQARILGHDSVGGFLTHAGWSSVVEAISAKKVMVLFTFYADQGLNASFLEERKLGYQIPRDESDGSFTSDSVAESLQTVMTGEKGKIYRDNVKEMSGLFGDRERQKCYVDNLLSRLVHHQDEVPKGY